MMVKLEDTGPETSQRKQPLKYLWSVTYRGFVLSGLLFDSGVIILFNVEKHRLEDGNPMKFTR